jgi:mitogen-activated protein kinase kinase
MPYPPAYFFTQSPQEIRLELDASKLNAILMELDILHRASAISAYIVDFYGAFFIESCVYYCMEYMDAGSLDKLVAFPLGETIGLDNDADPPDTLVWQGVPEPVLSRIAGDTVRGLKFLKDELEVIHRDVKPTNVLMNRKGELKLCDFGVSGQLERSLAKTNIGCQSYMAVGFLFSVLTSSPNPGRLA